MQCYIAFETSWCSHNVNSYKCFYLIDYNAIAMLLLSLVKKIKTEKAILKLKTENRFEIKKIKKFWNWKRKNCFEIENRKIGLKLKSENYFEIEKKILFSAWKKFKKYFETWFLFKTKKSFQNKKNPNWKWFFWKDSNSFKRFQITFWKNGFAHPCLFDQSKHFMSPIKNFNI